MLPKAAIQFTDAQKKEYEDGIIKADGSNAPDIESCLKPQFTVGDVNGCEYEIIRNSISEILKEEDERKKNRFTAKNAEEYCQQMMDQCCEK